MAEEFEGASSRPLWNGYLGSARIECIDERCVIDRCAAETGVLEFKVRGGGKRNLGFRPRAIDLGILSNRASFFQALRCSIADAGVKLPVLLYGINGRMYCRYGASRIHTCIGLGLPRIPAVLCQLTEGPVPKGFLPLKQISTPSEVLAAFGPPRVVGSFQCDHERIDAHHMEF